MSETKEDKLQRIARETAGFVEREIWTFNPDKEVTSKVELLIPNTHECKTYVNNSYARATTAEYEAVAARHVIKRKLEEQASGLNEEIEDKDKFAIAEVPSTHRPKLFSKREQDDRDKDPAVQRSVLEERAAKDIADLDPRQWYPVYEPLQPLKLLDSSRQTFGDKGQANSVYKTMRDKGHMRRLASVSADRAEQIFKELEETHPLFLDVTKFVRDEMRLCLRRKLPYHLSPILLGGPPGTGKTHYSKALAVAVGASFHEMPFDTDRQSSSFLGSSAHWSNTQPGQVFRALAMDDNASANPVILLDEIDKSRGYGETQHPLTSLHGLLEPVSNKKVTDISVSITLDSSLISWIATANDLNRVLPSIRSRFRIFVILPALDGETGLKVAAQVVKVTHKAMDIDGFATPGADVVRSIASLLFPRLMRMALEQGYAAAVAAGCMSLRAKDFEHIDPDYQEPKDGATIYH